jgi:tripartite-type tricarboxylate transporter receptor subunit TctC
MSQNGVLCKHGRHGVDFEDFAMTTDKIKRRKENGSGRLCFAVKGGGTRFMICTMLALLLSLPAAMAFADNYPSKPLTMLVGYTPGGSVDLVARSVADELGKHLGQPVLVENAAGASGTIAAAKAVRAPADGYTLLMGSGSEISIAKLTSSSVKYDGQKDLASITLVGTQAMVLVGANNLAPKTTDELMAYAKANPGKLSFGSSGVGTPLHLAGELIKHQAKISMEHVPYKGAGGMLTDLLGGQIPLAVMVLSSALPHIKAGKIKAFGVTEAKRSPALPDAPALSESKAVPGVDMGVWFGVFAPVKTPDVIVERLNREMNKVLNLPAVRNKLSDCGVVLAVRGPKDFASFVAAETSKYRQIVHTANIRTE